MKHLRVLGTFALAMISINAILSLRSLPAMASLGPQAISFFILAAVCFLIPSALVCAELSTAIPENGGIYTWVRTAFGDKTGFVAIWMEWANNIIAFPASLATIVATIAYIGFPTLATNKHELFTLMVLILWGTTLYNFLGIKASSRLNILGALFGLIVPGVIIIGLGCYWMITHPEVRAALAQQPILPDWHLGSLAIFISTLGAYSGMQITAFYAQNVNNPQRNFPRAIALATVVILIVSILATLSISAVLPHGQVNWINGVIESFSVFFQTFHLTFLTPILAALIVLGSIGSLSAWLLGPARGLRNACEQHHILHKFARNSKRDIPLRILVLQALICTGLAAIFLFMPTLKSAFWLLITLTSQFTVLMYILVFAATIRLRYSQAKLPRPFRIPGGNSMVWLVCGVGITTCVAGFCLGLFPPSSIGITHVFSYAMMVLLGDVVLIAIPLLFLALSKRGKA